jgi:hypothetical protein
MSGRVPVVDETIAQLAGAARRRGWGAPLLAILETVRPLALPAGQLLWLAQPFLTLFGAGDGAGRWARVLEEPTSLAALMAELEHEGPV